MANNIKFGFILDIASFNKGIKSAIRDTQSLASTFKNVNKAFKSGDWTKGVQGISYIVATSKKLTAMPFQTAASAVSNLTTRMARLGTTALNTWRRLNGGVSGLAGLAFKFNMVTQAVNTVMGPIVNFAKAVSEPAAESEKLALSFDVLLGSADAAKEHVAGLVDYAAHTPFAMEDISSASAALISFGIPAKESTRVLKQLGDVAAMTNSSMKDLAMIYGKVANGKIDAVVAKQLTNLRINMKSHLKELRGWTNGQYAEALSGGKLGQRDLDDVLEKITSEGGQFYKGAERLSHTLAGLISTMGDNIKLAMSDIGAGINEALKPAVSHITNLIEQARPSLKEFGEFAGSVIARWVDRFKQMTDWLQKYRYSIYEAMKPVLEGYGKVLDGLKSAVKWIIESTINIWGLLISGC